MEYAFSFQKVLEGNGIAISITGMSIVFFALISVTLLLILLPKVLKIINKIFPEVEEEIVLVSGPLTEDKEIVAAIGYALLKSKSNL